MTSSDNYQIIRWDNPVKFYPDVKGALDLEIKKVHFSINSANIFNVENSFFCTYLSTNYSPKLCICQKYLKLLKLIVIFIYKKHTDALVSGANFTASVLQSPSFHPRQIDTT